MSRSCPECGSTNTDGRTIDDVTRARCNDCGHGDVWDYMEHPTW